MYLKHSVSFKEGFKHGKEVLCDLVNISGVGGVLVNIAVARTHWVVHKENVGQLDPGGIARIQVYIIRTNLPEVTKSCGRPSRSTLHVIQWNLVTLRQSPNSNQF